MKEVTFPVIALVVVGGFLASGFPAPAHADTSTMTLQCTFDECSLAANFPGYVGPTSIYWSFEGVGAPSNASSCNNQLACPINCKEPTTAPLTVSVSVYAGDSNSLLGSTTAKMACGADGPPPGNPE